MTPLESLRQVEEEMRSCQASAPPELKAIEPWTERWAARLRGAIEGMREEIARIEEQVRVVVDGSDPISITLRGDGDWFRAHLLRLRTLRLQMESGEQDQP